MIGEPEVEVTCESCSENIFITPEYMYRDYSGKSGFYDFEDEAIEKIIKSDHGWGVEEGCHFCEDCWQEMTDNTV